jgi:uncharacterized membrane protein (TIGR02234 family)
MRERIGLIAAVLLDLLGAAIALLVSSRTWQTIHVDRNGLQALRTDLTGHTVDGTVAALAVVGLAAAVAVLATRGTLRRIVGLVLAAAGLTMLWLSIAARGAVGTGEARSDVADKHHGVVLSGASFRVTTHAVWPWLSALGGVFVLAAGVLVAARGHRWKAMSARYEAPAPDDETARARADLSMWNALERGDDPTQS